MKNLKILALLMLVISVALFNFIFSNVSTTTAYIRGVDIVWEQNAN